MHAKYAYLDGTAIQYFHTGRSTLPDARPDLSRGKVVVCVHGEGGNGNLWHRQVRALAESHSPIAFDFPGHGRSGGTDSLKSIDAYADLTHALLDHLGVDSCVVIGHSMGAAAALTLAARHPKRIAALALCAAAQRFAFPETLVETWGNVMRGRSPQPFTLEGFSPKADMAAVRETFMENVKTDPRVRYFDMLACNAFDGAALGAQIAAPTLVVAGRDDQLVPLSASEALHTAIASSRLHVIDDAGHSLLLEKPDALSTALLDFVGGLS